MSWSSGYNCREKHGLFDMWLPACVSWGGLYLQPKLWAWGAHGPMTSYGRSPSWICDTFRFKYSTGPALFVGDCKNCIHLWEPASGSTWNVDSTPFLGHSASVEDLQVSYINGSLLFFYQLLKQDVMQMASHVLIHAVEPNRAKCICFLFCGWKYCYMGY